MPGNTTNTNLGIPIEYQNPGVVNAVLDSEVIGTDNTTGAQLSREFVIPTNSISGQTAIEVLVPIMARMLVELRAIRNLLEAGALPDVIDDLEDINTSDEPETEVEES